MNFLDVSTWQAIGTGVAAFFMIVAGMRGAKKSDGTPPAERAPTTHELKEALSNMTSLVEGLRETLRDIQDQDRDRYYAVSRQLDRLEAQIGYMSNMKGRTND